MQNRMLCPVFRVQCVDFQSCDFSEIEIYPHEEDAVRLHLIRRKEDSQPPSHETVVVPIAHLLLQIAKLVEWCEHRPTAMPRPIDMLKPMLDTLSMMRTITDDTASTTVEPVATTSQDAAKAAERAVASVPA